MNVVISSTFTDTRYTGRPTLYPLSNSYRSFEKVCDTALNSLHFRAVESLRAYPAVLVGRSGAVEFNLFNSHIAQRAQAYGGQIDALQINRALYECVGCTFISVREISHSKAVKVLNLLKGSCGTIETWYPHHTWICSSRISRP